MAARSLTRQLIVTLTLGATLLWLLAAGLAANSLRLSLETAFDGGLRETAERLLPLALDGFGSDGDEGGGHSEAHEVPRFDQGAAETVVYQLRGADGGVLLRSHDAPVEPFDAPLVAEGFTDSGPWRVYTLGQPGGGGYIQVAETLAHRAQSLWSSVIPLLWPLALLIPLSALGIYFAVRQGLEPIRRLSAEIAARHAANLAPIGATDLPIEVAPIAEAVDGLIARVRAALDAERSFAANSAHELRTPIAGSLAQVQRLIAELDGLPQQQRARQVEDSLARLRALGDRLLQLSRAEAGMAQAATAIDLMPALRLVVDDARRQLGDPARLRLEVRGELAAPIDVDAFGILLRNLIDNARLHGAASEPIVIGVEPHALEVGNGGEMVPADKLATLSQRFARGSTQAPGSGLGLAIVDAIMRQVGGRLVLASPAPGRQDGFAARLEFPG